MRWAIICGRGWRMPRAHLHTAGDRFRVVRSSGGYEMGDRRLFAGREETTCALVDPAVGKRRAIYPAQVLRPGLDNKALDVPSRLSRIPKQSPLHGAVAAPKATKLAHRNDELACRIELDAVLGGDQHRPFFWSRR